MTREEAARVLMKEADGWGDERVLYETYLAALRMGAAALREPQWVKTSERVPMPSLPEQEDAE